MFLILIILIIMNIVECPKMTEHLQKKDGASFYRTF